MQKLNKSKNIYSAFMMITDDLYRFNVRFQILPKLQNEKIQIGVREYFYVII